MDFYLVESKKTDIKLLRRRILRLVTVKVCSWPKADSDAKRMMINDSDLIDLGG